MRILKNLRKFAREGRIALVDEHSTLTFDQLNSRSDAIAFWLAENIPAGKPVALWGDKEHDLTCCIFGALKANHPYVILPSHYPGDRLEAILQDCGAPAVFHIGPGIMPCSHPYLLYSRDIDAWAVKYQGCQLPDDMGVQPEDICCIFYTSGSTGLPKGVQTSRANIEAYLAWWGSLANAWLPQAGGRALNFASYAFCASMGNLFYVLADRGMALYAVNRSLAMDYSRLFDYILQVDPQYQAGTPSFFTVCLQDPRFSQEYLPHMQFIVVSGEILPISVARQLLQRFPAAYICNKYGTTESTIGAIACRVTADMLADNSHPVPLGSAAPESQGWVVDENHNLLPDGQKGELAIICSGIYDSAENRFHGRVAAKYQQQDRPRRPERKGQITIVRKDLEDYGQGKIIQRQATDENARFADPIALVTDLHPGTPQGQRKQYAQLLHQDQRR